MAVLAFLNKWARNVGGYDSINRFGGTAHRIHSTSAVNLVGTQISASAITGAAAGDTFISAVLIPANATAINVTLTGFVQDETSAAQTITLTGSTSVDTLYPFDQLINYAAAAQITASVADKVIVWHGYP